MTMFAPGAAHPTDTPAQHGGRAEPSGPLMSGVLLEHLPGLFFLCNGQGQLLRWNKNLARVSGYGAELAGTPFLELFAQESRAELEEAIEEAFAGGAVSLEADLLAKDGGTVPYLLTAERVVVEGQVYVAVTGTDISARKEAEETLAASEARFRSFAERIDDVFWASEPGKGLSYVSPAFEKVWGRSLAELRDNHKLFLEGVHPDDRAEVAAAFDKRVRNEGREHFVEYRVVHPDGAVRWLRDRAYPLLDEQGEVYRVLGVAEDVTARKAAEEALIEQRELYEVMLGALPVDVVLFDAYHRYLFCNPTAIGNDAIREWIIGKDDFDYCAYRGFDVSIAQTRRAHFERAVAGRETVAWEESFTNAKGEERSYWRHLKPVFSPEGELQLVLGYGCDITKRKRAKEELESLNRSLEGRVGERTAALAKANERLQHDAFHDALTGLPNRALFMDRLGQTLERGKREQEHAFAVFFLDFDRFKVVNDSLGHAAGDALLVAIGERLRESLRPGDTVARLGGDEFTLLALGVKGEDEALVLARRLKALFVKPFCIEGRELHINASVGIVLSELGYGSAADVLRDADIAMYRAKALGRGEHALFDAAMREEARSLMTLESELRQALRKEQLEVHYQPIITTQGGKVTGFEALARWRHPMRGLVSPAQFIPVAEEVGLITDIGRFVLSKACKQTARWQRQTGHPLTVNVNVSSQEFAQPGFVEQVRAALEEAGLPAPCLRLELTESLLMDGSPEVKEALSKLRALGVGLQIDDFGTGYSSLSYLQRFDADALKIDRSFIAKLDSPESAELVRTIVAMAHNLGMKVVAEGVETDGQRNMLQALGCEYLQGYLFSKPLKAEEAAGFLEGAGETRTAQKIDKAKPVRAGRPI